MIIRLSDLWRWDGAVDRGPYVIFGITLFALKHNIDRIVSAVVFNRPWSLFNYMVPGEAVVTDIPNEKVTFYATLLALAIPFIYTGVVLTLRRLRSAGLPVVLVVLFFLPLINLFFFILLAVLPPKPTENIWPRDSRFSNYLGRLIPRGALGAALMSQLLLIPFGLLACLLSITFLKEYGWGLFVGLPFALGMGAVLIYGYHERRSFGSCLLVQTLSIGFFGLALFALAIEGIICLMMAAPIGWVLSFMGGLVGYVIQARPWTQQHAAKALSAILFLTPFLMGAEYLAPPEYPLIAVKTAIIIDAPPEVVWKHVVSFAELPEPDSWLFKAGIAYPMRAEIHGEGVGAVRYCIFSTGPFVEPITVWDEPRLLKFSVTQQPRSMNELSIYANIDAPHIDDYLKSEGGQFLLEHLPDGKTRLEGTTWYRHRIWPAAYWRVWSDIIIHRIHMRVLRHIQKLSQSQG